MFATFQKKKINLNRVLIFFQIQKEKKEKGKICRMKIEHWRNMNV